MFEVDRLYRRRELHEMYGGQEQGGISTPRGHPLIFLFTGDVGTLYGYRDHWDDDGVFHITGEGQLGDMEMVRGNRAILNHAREGKELHLFEMADRGCVRYIGEMACIGYDLVPNVPDRRGVLRTVIVFRLAFEDQDVQKRRVVLRAGGPEVTTPGPPRPREPAPQAHSGHRPPGITGESALDSAIEFVPGKRYRNRRGFYEVVTVKPPRMQIRYDDGQLADADIATQERIFANMRAEDRHAKRR